MRPKITALTLAIAMMVAMVIPSLQTPVTVTAAAQDSHPTKPQRGLDQARPLTEAELDAQVKEGIGQLKLNTARIMKSMEAFQTAYPRFVKAIRRGEVTRDVFHQVWIGKKNEQIRNLLERYEAKTLSSKDLVTTIREQQEPDDVQMQSDSCTLTADTYYRGCIDGGGDPFICFGLTEHLLCLCQTQWNIMCFWD